MALLGQTFDANTVAPRTAMEALPVGDYHGQIVASEWKENTKGTGRYLELQLDVLSGPLAGRKAWDRLNLDNPNATAVEIAAQTLSAICHATGQMSVSDSVQLHFKPLIFKMGFQKGSTTQTEVKGYRAADGTPLPAGPTRAPTPAVPARAAPVYGQQPAYGQTQPAGAPSYGPPATVPPNMPPPQQQAAPGNGPWARG